MKKVLAGMVAIAALLGLSPGVAEASGLQCSAYSCWRNGGINGVQEFTGSLDMPTTYCYPVTANVIDWVSNGTSKNWAVWDGNGCTGAASTVYAGTQGSLGGWNDRINSLRRNP